MELKHDLANWFRSENKVLIVPYGIETFECPLLFFEPEVLIVPYGIETSSMSSGERE